MKVVSIAEMLCVENECARQGISQSQLMENAGRAVAENARYILKDIPGKDIAVLVGPGNNGGDGLVAARYLQNWGAAVSIYLFREFRSENGNYQQAVECGVVPVLAEKDNALLALEKLLTSADMVIDAVFGTGQHRVIEGVYQQALLKLSAIRRQRPELKVVSVDIPSGLDADSGAVDPATPWADFTVTLGFPKRGLFTPTGAARAGTVIIADIGIPGSISQDLKTELLTADLARSLLPARSAFAHKGSFGKVLVSAGSSNYIGAAYLAAAGAVRTGTGLVALALPRSLQPVIAARLAEAIYLPLPETEPGVISGLSSGLVLKTLKNYDSFLIGCGLGQGETTREYFTRVFLAISNMDVKSVIDADGLNIMGQIQDWQHKIAVDAVLTPHAGEMARLCGLTADDVQNNRIELAMHKAGEWHKTVVLKGAFTLVAAADGRCRISPFANAGLASAGTGDVLAGIIAGLIAQGMELFDAASLGVYIHAQAGERVKQKLGDAGMLASDLLPELPLIIKGMKEGVQYDACGGYREYHY
jgi:NAD(P)H-hydrate epimerase